MPADVVDDEAQQKKSAFRLFSLTGSRDHDLRLSMKETASVPVSPEQRQAVVSWLQTQVAEMPEELRSIASQLIDELALPKSSSQAKRTWLQLGRALGIVPSSEKRRSSRPTGGARGGSKPKPKTEIERLKQEIESSETELERDMAKRNRKQRKKARLKRRLKKLLGQQKAQADEQAIAGEADEADLLDIDENTPDDDIPLTDEDIREIQEAKRATMSRMTLGDGAESALRSPLESLMTASQVATFTKTVPVPATLPPDIDESAVVRTLHQNRVRYDFTLSVTEVNLDVEKKVVVGKDGQRRVYSGSTTPFGPPKYSVTWGTLATLAVLVGQFAMPMNRLATLLSTSVKSFTTASLGRMIHYIAVRFFPIYTVLLEDLSNARSFSGDDTSARVVDVSRHFAEAAEPGQKRRESPWSAFATREAAESTYREWLKETEDYEKAKAERGRLVQGPGPGPLPLSVWVGRELTFESDRRDGNGKKRSLNTTVVSGRSEPANPESLIIFYRTHLGSLGNLMEELLRRREKRYRSLTILSDLSTANLVVDEELLSCFEILLAGCASHARRPFALYESDDPVDAGLMLSHFKLLSTQERSLNRIGRNFENVQAVRNMDSKPIWQDIKELAHEMTERWSKSTPLGQACHYIIKNFVKLTAYLTDPFLEWTNNFSERMLRPEKLIEKNSLFRQTLDGRVALDIIRTIIQTACASGIPVHEYLTSVLRADPKDIEENPRNYTPLAHLRRTQAAEQSKKSA